MLSKIILFSMLIIASPAMGAEPEQPQVNNGTDVDLVRRLRGTPGARIGGATRGITKDHLEQDILAPSRPAMPGGPTHVQR